MWLDITTTILGLLYIWLEYKVDIRLWIVAILMPLLDIILYWQHGLYGDSAMAVYYTLAAIYGFIIWQKPHPTPSKQGSGTTPVTFMPRHCYLPVFAVFLAAWGVTWYLLSRYTNSTVPVMDSFTNALSIVGMWALARKYVEQWSFWIVVDVVCCYLYATKGIPFKAGLYGLYVAIAVAGYIKWRRMAKEAQPHPQEVGLEAECCILANGCFPQSEQTLSILRNAKYICCCDGAVEKLIKVGLTPNVIVGDGDSIPEALKKRFSNIFIQIDEQDFNDMTKATLHCRSLGYRNLTYLGTTGLREDHTIGNIFLLPYYLDDLGVNPTIVTDHGIFTAHRGHATLTTHPGQQVSIFNISCTTMTGTGLRWPLSPFKQLWQGTLNEATAHEITITTDSTYLVFRNNS